MNHIITGLLLNYVGGNPKSETINDHTNRTIYDLTIKPNYVGRNTTWPRPCYIYY